MMRAAMRRPLQPCVLVAALLTASAASAQPAAAPPTAAGNTGLSVRPGVEVFAQYAARLTNTTAGETEWFHRFDVPRVHAALTGEYRDARARVVLEAVRSAAEGSLVGVDGDSLVFRVREAYASWNGRPLHLQAGVVPTLTLPEIEGTWRLRAVAPTPLEVTALGSPADLGATARFDLPRTFGWVGVGAYNGEGYNGRELNRGKNVEIVASVHPFPWRAMQPLAVLASYTLGSSGTGAARANRFTGALLWQGASLRVGLTGTVAWGVDDDGGRLSYLLEGFARFEPVERLITGLRVSWWQRDDREESDRVTTILGTVGYRVLDPLEIFGAVSRQIPGARAEDALPGSDHWEFRLVTRGVY